MADLDVLEVAQRERTGSAATRRLRRDGNVPAILYGHGEETQHLSISVTQVSAIARNHTKMVKLAGAIRDTALISEMQWDPLGIEIIHLDMIRVNLKEKVEVSVPIHVHGDPVGVREGGVFIENVHDVEIRCPAGDIPESLDLNVNELHLGESLIAKDLELPSGVELLTPEETVVAHVEEPRIEPELEEGEEEAVGVEPEVIARGGEEEESEED